MKTRKNKVIDFGCECDIYIRKNIIGIDDNCNSPYMPYKITVHRDNPVYCSKGNCLIEKATKTLIFTGLNFSIPDDGSVENIGVYAFARWDDYSSMPDVIDIPHSVKHIFPKAFYMAFARYIALQEDIKTIGAQAFAYSTIRSVFIPKTVKRIAEDAFFKCNNLRLIYSENPRYVAKNGCLIDKRTMTLIAVCAHRKIIIPDGVKTIAGGVFWGDVKHAEVYIPPSVHKIHGHNFYDCYRRVRSSNDNNDYYDYKVKIYVCKGTYAEYFAKKHVLEYKICDNCVIFGGQDWIK